MLKTVWVLPSFIIGLAALTWINIFFLGRGDPKFGQTDLAFRLYLAVWLIGFAPHILTGWLVLAIKVRSSRMQVIILAAYIIALWAMFEALFLLDAKWAVLCAGWVGSTLGAITLRKYFSKRPSEVA
jgi:hypothetical protein